MVHIKKTVAQMTFRDGFWVVDVSDVRPYLPTAIPIPDPGVETRLRTYGTRSMFGTPTAECAYCALH